MDGCQLAVTARTRSGWVTFMEYGDSLHGKGFF